VNSKSSFADLAFAGNRLSLGSRDLAHCGTTGMPNATPRIVSTISFRRLS